jgi:hypothetical protein
VMTATHTADHLDGVLRRRMFMLAQSPTFPPRDNSSGRYDVILDSSAASECIIRDKELLANIRSAETAIEVVGIAPGHPSIKLDTVGDLFGLGTVFYSPLVAANVLSFADMEARHEVTYRKGSFEVKLASGNVVAFNREASQHPGVGYFKHYVARFPRRFAVAPAIQGAFFGRGGEPSADEPSQGLVRATAVRGRRAAVEVPKKKEIENKERNSRATACASWPRRSPGLSARCSGDCDRRSRRGSASNHACCSGGSRSPKHRSANTSTCCSGGCSGVRSAGAVGESEVLDYRSVGSVDRI